MANTRGIQIDDQGACTYDESVTLADMFAELSRRLQLFLLRLESCPTIPSGVRVLRDPAAGRLDGVRILWEDVATLCAVCHVNLLNLEYGFHGGVSRQVHPLHECLKQLTWAIPHADGEWATAIAAPVVAKVRALAAEIDLHAASMVPPALAAGPKAPVAEDGDNTSAAQDDPSHPLSENQSIVLSVLKPGVTVTLDQAVTLSSKAGGARSRSTVQKILADLEAAGAVVRGKNGRGYAKSPERPGDDRAKIGT